MDTGSHKVIAQVRALCPECGDFEIMRSRRRNVLERLISSVGLYPHRCVACGHRFYTQLRDR